MKKDFDKVLVDYGHALQTLDDSDHGRLSEDQEEVIKKKQSSILQQQLYEGKITWLEFMQQSEYSEEFRQYCEDNALPKNEQTAQQFFDAVMREEEQNHRRDALKD